MTFNLPGFSGIDARSGALSPQSVCCSSTAAMSMSTRWKRSGRGSRFFRPTCKALFHELICGVYIADSMGPLDMAGINKRGIRAVEEALGTKLNERIDCVTQVDEWVVRHWAYCNGFTTLVRRPQ